MWKKEDAKSHAGQEISTTHAVTMNTPSSPALTPSPVREPVAHASSTASPRAEAAGISPGIRIKGEVTGSEDLFVDGQVEGKLSLTNGSLTIGPNGQVKADVTAREIVVRGKVEGKVSGRDKVVLGSTGHVNGEVQTDRLVIEDGAVLRGRVEAGKQPGKGAEEHAVAAGVAAAGTKGGSAVTMGSGTAAD
ncbi:MAG TPA: polymer-forming cytoskeletal protein [Candidatus Acidoferrum sp.]|nr:polymer-forming cytoskeletal protein [Candidatus Acidoferrum sp.]